MSKATSVRVAAVRWLSDEPQPGWVEYELTDADGVTWSFFDKPIHGGWEAMTPSASYPLASSFACEILRTEMDARGDVVVVISTFEVESTDGRSEFRVSPSQIES